MRLSIIVAGIGLLIAGLPATATAQDTTYSPTFMLTEGKELIAVYFGATTCVPCHDPDLKRNIKRTKPLLKRNAEAAGYTFSVTGAALDWSVKEGIEFLEEVGPFDEVIVGKTWSNLAAVDYMWADTASFTALPQVVLIEREVINTANRMVFSPNVIMARYVGAKTVADWVDAGAPLCWTTEEYGSLSWIKPDCGVPLVFDQ